MKAIASAKTRDYDNGQKDILLAENEGQRHARGGRLLRPRSAHPGNKFLGVSDKESRAGAPLIKSSYSHHRLAHPQNSTAGTTTQEAINNALDDFERFQEEVRARQLK